MKNEKIIAITVLVIVVILLILYSCRDEPFTIFPRYYQNIYNDFNPYELVVLENKTPPYVKLYEGFNWKKRVFDVSLLEFPYLRLLKPINLKSFDIDLTGAPASQSVELWSVYPNSAVSSTQATGIYTDIYREPEYAFRANTPKYQKIAEVKGGEILKENVDDVVKRVFIVVKS